MIRLDRKRFLELGYFIKIEENGQPQVYKERTKKNGTKSYRKIKSHKHIAKHPYGKDKVYICVALCDNKKKMTTTLSRLTYLYFKGDIERGYDVDHIDNDPLNNNPNNLQTLPRALNLLRRPMNQKEINFAYWAIKKAESENKDE